MSDNAFPEDKSYFIDYAVEGADESILTVRRGERHVEQLHGESLKAPEIIGGNQEAAPSAGSNPATVE